MPNAFSQVPDSRPYEKKRTAIIVDHQPLCQRWSALQNAKRVLEADHAALLREITSALFSASTTGSLIRRWPEIEKLVASMFPVERASLPAPLLTDLNKKLGLRA